MNGSNKGRGRETQIKLPFQFTCSCIARLLSPEETGLHPAPHSSNHCPLCSRWTRNHSTACVHTTPVSHRGWRLPAVWQQLLFICATEILSLWKFLLSGKFHFFSPEYSDCIAPVVTCLLFKSTWENRSMGISKKDSWNYSFCSLSISPFLLFTQKHTITHPVHTLWLSYFLLICCVEGGRRILVEYGMIISRSSQILFLFQPFFCLSNAFGFILTVIRIV